MSSKGFLIENRHFFLFFCCVLMASVIYSPFLLSVSMFAFAFLVLLQLKVGLRHFSLKYNKADAPRLRDIFKYPSFGVVTLIFFLVLLSFWQTIDYPYWFSRLRIKLPFLVFPLMFVALPRITDRELKGLLYFLVFALGLTGIGIGINYLLHFEEINILLKQGQPMPTPYNHIRFSLLVALGIVSGLYLIETKYYLKYPWERKWIIATTIFLFLFMHLLSVRSGLVCLYAALLVLLLRYILLTKRYLIGLGLVLGLCLMPILAIQFIPSFKSKIAYMKYDYYMYNRGEGGLYSDSGRVVSLKIGWDIFKAHPWLGVGAGNLDAAVSKEFETEFPAFETYHMPHNQFLFVAASNGLIGLLIFSLAFFFPFFYRSNYKHPVLLGFYAITFISWLVEHGIENAIGAGFFIFFLSVLLSNLNKE